MIIIKNENTRLFENASKRIVTYLDNKITNCIPNGLISISEICLHQTDKIDFNQKENQNIIIIPLVGNFVYNDKIIKPNEILFDQQVKNVTYNLQQTDLDFGYAIIIQTEINCNANFLKEIKITNNSLNSLLNIDNVLEIKAGIYSLRKKDCIKYSENKNFIAFALAGAFELNERLIETKELLLIENESELDFEALSDQGLLLIIELKTS